MKLITSIYSYPIVTFTLLFVFFTRCSPAKKFTYKKVPNSLYSSVKKKTIYKKEVAKLLSEAYDLTAVIEKCTNTLNCTNLIQEEIYKHSVLLLPNSSIKISKKGLTIPSSKKIIFQEKSKLILEANSLESYQVLRLFNVKNVTIYYPKISGDRLHHKGTTGEWGMGISIKGSENVKIINPVIINSWGDGIYLGTTNKINKNIEIINPIIDNSRRNGISVISANNLLIDSPVISNTNGTIPSSGIDIEPNNNKDIIDNIEINNPITYNNESNGILIYLRAYRGLATRIINIRINTPVDSFSKRGFYIDSSEAKTNEKKELLGSIIIESPNWAKSKELSLLNSGKNYPKIKIVE